MLVKKDNVIIFFGDAKSCPVDYRSADFIEYCKIFAPRVGLDAIFFNVQVHGADGCILNSIDAVKSFTNRYHDGDFFITNQKSIGIGILTADCLPILFYDKKNGVVAAIHAGWRSATAEICKIVLMAMSNNFGTIPDDLDVYFGPSAKSCCYEVKSDFLVNLKHFPCIDKVLNYRDGKFFFDNVMLNKLLLKDVGIDLQKINCDHNLCTICNHSFNSYRRDSKSCARQISFIAIV